MWSMQGPAEPQAPFLDGLARVDHEARRTLVCHGSRAALERRDGHALPAVRRAYLDADAVVLTSRPGRNDARIPRWGALRDGQMR